ncbi:lipid-binding SYLF domain-containing protein [Histidinibacterium aquaticum]|uniref:Twin-arginine translocation pathway signal n=1 Tax=Histidinibacterium aquaticum TaxID=2613962 RepID=A0A5J5GM00_9RHOB|nr:YSC84-related protein [Histidinibacterium aquaticum]KAA9009225.1 twin-arginine translocation pathway signal [Histidinibacterium aquaticum]
MSSFTRRSLLAGLGASTLALAACGNGIGSRSGPMIDARVDTTLNFMRQTYPSSDELLSNAAGVLVMPLVTEAGFGVGGAYGRGALRVGGTTVDYYSAATASAGLQIGAQQYSHVLFFMTDAALANFRRSDGWVAGANIEYALKDQADSLAAETLTSRSPVIALVFAQAGLRVGATVEGTKYTRIIP